jgi:hypothetical protein
MIIEMRFLDPAGSHPFSSLIPSGHFNPGPAGKVALGGPINHWSYQEVLLYIYYLLATPCTGKLGLSNPADN